MGTKRSLLIKFGQFISYYKRKKIKNVYKICNLKTNSKPFCVCKELSTKAIEKWIFWRNLLILDMLEQNYQNLLKSACKTHLIPFYRGFLQNFKKSGTSSQVTNFIDFFDKIFSFVISHKLANFITRLCLLPKLFSKIHFVFQAWAFDDIMTFECLKSC